MSIFTRTKIIATIGPSSSSEKELEKLVRAGISIARINFSHGSYEDHAKVIGHIRSINERSGTHVGILADLQGPKIRLGSVQDDGVQIRHGDEIVITTEPCLGNAHRVHITYPSFAGDVAKGDRVLINDGKLILRVKDTDRVANVTAIVEHGGLMESRKGVNLPNTVISLPSLTEKDLQDLDFLLKHNVEWVGLSFVRQAKDVIELKQRILAGGSTARVVAKIEKPEAVKDITNIIRHSDAVMVARGDLGVEVPMQELPVIQKMIVRRCLAQAKPVIIATQMMESMIVNPSPNRAEVNDVANSVMDGADAVMLSGETSVGAHPSKVVEAMSSIIEHVEQFSDIYYRELITGSRPDRAISDAICRTAVGLSKETNASAIITMSHSGYTGFRISSYRPRSPIFVFTDNLSILTTLNLVWGVRGFYYDRYASTDETIADIKGLLKTEGMLQQEDLVINIASMPITDRGSANMLKLSHVE
ncbi:MAG: pyruvate kinase [Flavobacteriales bacterium]|nr:pyruvate kinase [Flavobacteriales bacterium]